MIGAPEGRPVGGRPSGAPTNFGWAIGSRGSLRPRIHAPLATVGGPSGAPNQARQNRTSSRVKNCHPPRRACRLLSAFSTVAPVARRQAYWIVLPKSCTGPSSVNTALYAHSFHPATPLLRR